MLLNFKAAKAFYKLYIIKTKLKMLNLLILVFKKPTKFDIKKI